MDSISIPNDADSDGNTEFASEYYKDFPKLSAGYIVSEKPTFLNFDSVLCVINNQKCSLYDSKSGSKLSSTNLNDEMVVGAKSFTFDGRYEILISGSSNGVISCYNVNKGGNSLDLLIRAKISCKRLLSVDVSPDSGAILLIYLTNKESITTEISVMTFDFLGIIKSTEIDVNQAIDLDPSSSDCKHVKSFKRVCSLLSKVDVYATNRRLNLVGIGIGKSVLILNIATYRITYFELIGSVCCMAFDSRNFMALGDSTGRIIIYDLDHSDDGNENLVMVCDMPQSYFDLNPIHLRQKANFLTTNRKLYSKDEDFGYLKNFARLPISARSLHWHAHGVNCMSFNRDGSILLSGGEEGVLVIWHLNSNSKKFVTRLGSAIFHLGISNSEDLYFAACEANEIFFIDPSALSIKSRISGLSIPMSIGIKSTKEYTQLPLESPAEALEENTDITYSNVNVESHVPIFKYWPHVYNDLVNASKKDAESTMIGGNVVVSSRPNKLQIFNYVKDCEIGSLDLKTVNIISRQDDEFGEDWNLDEMCVSSDGLVVLTIQSRKVLHTTDTIDEPSMLYPQFEHETLSNNKKSTLKFWVRMHDKEGLGFVAHTKISNPHTHKVTYVAQISNTYAFLTASMDSEFKIWNVVKKAVFPNNLGFVTYSDSDLKELKGKSFKNETVDDYIWICVSVGSYRNMPCITASINESGNLICVVHDLAVSVWEINKKRQFEFVKAVMVNQPKYALEKNDIITHKSDVSFIKFISPYESRFVIISGSKRLCIWDITNDKSLWEYPITEDQEIDKVIYERLLPNILVVTTSHIDNGKYVGTLEMYLFDISNENVVMKEIFSQKRSISRMVLNMCLSPSAIDPSVFNTKNNDLQLPVFPFNFVYTTLVLLTSNFQIETIAIMSELYKNEPPKIFTIDSVERSMDKTTVGNGISEGDDLDIFEQILNLQKEQLKHYKKRKERINLTEQFCKANEWNYRAKNPIPENLVNSVVDVGCPSHSLPAPNVVFNRLANILGTMHPDY
ncbi:hypothetical protein BEWA_030860 [Theileria equi strain WA]|uniref:Uncharacterized protein n=1 Tax=Theileria equi strain WA TaxID=1537102 RepID=L0AY97_THEEQ|nr:hypothetical protein BEWA_030860 [Theileria equi strain WA]AFZ80233.1 hypothetical protein BEWA_030860 [Theileria equi strain WA]|eukprot:XP_004829899.1 hypothetical protein BEWA_030860 [Theileria equi strain WA]